MIIHEIERIQHSKMIDQLILATSTERSDDALIEVCKQYHIETFRGSLTDVLDRFYQAALQYHPDHIVRLTGDCPVLDAAIMDQVIQLHLAEANDYTSNTLIPTYPDGLDVEICTFAALQTAHEQAALLSEREHVTLYIHTRPDIFKLGGLQNNEDLSKLRWTVDEIEDFELITKIYQHLYPRRQFFAMRDIVTLFQADPGLAMINGIYRRNEGLKKSLVQDRKV